MSSTFPVDAESGMPNQSYIPASTQYLANELYDADDELPGDAVKVPEISDFTGEEPDPVAEVSQEIDSLSLNGTRTDSISCTTNENTGTNTNTDLESQELKDLELYIKRDPEAFSQTVRDIEKQQRVNLEYLRIEYAAEREKNSLLSETEKRFFTQQTELLIKELEEYIELLSNLSSDLLPEYRIAMVKLYYKQNPKARKDLQSFLRVMKEDNSQEKTGLRFLGLDGEASSVGEVVDYTSLPRMSSPPPPGYSSVETPSVVSTPPKHELDMSLAMLPIVSPPHQRVSARQLQNSPYRHSARRRRPSRSSSRPPRKADEYKSYYPPQLRQSLYQRYLVMKQKEWQIRKYHLSQLRDSRYTQKVSNATQLGTSEDPAGFWAENTGNSEEMEMDVDAPESGNTGAVQEKPVKHVRFILQANELR